MTFQTLNEFNSTGVGGILVYVAQTVPIFVPLVLFSIFIIVTLGIFLGTQRMTGGGGSFWDAIAIGSWFTLIVAFIMTLEDGMINITTISICFVISLITTVMALTSKQD